MSTHDHVEIALKGKPAGELLKQLGELETASLTLDFGQTGPAEGHRKRKASKEAPSKEPMAAKMKRSAVSRRRWYLILSKSGDSAEIQTVIEAAVATARRSGPAQALKLLGGETGALLAEPSTLLIADRLKHEAQRWAETREAFLAEHRSVTAPELAELTGSKAKNASARAHSWVKAGRIFSVNDGTAERYPLFQLQEGEPLPQMADILSILRRKLTNWQIALWLTSPNAWVGEWQTPIRVLAKQPDVVTDAARHEIAEKVL